VPPSPPLKRSRKARNSLQRTTKITLPYQKTPLRALLPSPNSGSLLSETISAFQSSSQIVTPVLSSILSISVSHISATSLPSLALNFISTLRPTTTLRTRSSKRLISTKKKSGIPATLSMTALSGPKSNGRRIRTLQKSLRLRSRGIRVRSQPLSFRLPLTLL